MKQWLLSLVAVLLAACLLVGCGGGQSVPADADAPDAASAAPEEQDDTPEEPPEEEPPEEEGLPEAAPEDLL